MIAHPPADPHALCGEKIRRCSSLGSLKWCKLAPYVAVVNSDDGVTRRCPSMMPPSPQAQGGDGQCAKAQVWAGVRQHHGLRRLLQRREGPVRDGTTEDRNSPLLRVCGGVGGRLKKSKRSLGRQGRMVINGQLDGPSGKEFEAMIGAEPATAVSSPSQRGGPHLQHPARALESRDSRIGTSSAAAAWRVADVGASTRTSAQVRRDARRKEVVGGWEIVARGTVDKFAKCPACQGGGWPIMDASRRTVTGQAPTPGRPACLNGLGLGAVAGVLLVSFIMGTRFFRAGQHS